MYVQLLKKALQQKRILCEEADDGTGAGKTTGGSETDDGGVKPGEGEGEGDGKKNTPSVSDAEAKLIKENMKKKEEIELLKKKLNETSSVVDKLTSLGGLDAIEALVTAQKTAEEERLQKAGDWDRLKAQMAEQHDKTVKGLQKTIEEQNSKIGGLVGQLDELTIGTAFTQSGFIKNTVLTPTKARTVFGAHFDLVDGQVVGFDKPRGAANRTPIVDAYGNNVSFDEALKKIVDADPEKDSILKSTLNPGSGSNTTRATKKTESAVATDSISKIAAGLKQDKQFQITANNL